MAACVDAILRLRRCTRSCLEQPEPGPHIGSATEPPDPRPPCRSDRSSASSSPSRTIEGRRRQAAPRLRLRQHDASSIRSCCFDDFRNDNPDDYLRRLPVASASRHRDHHLRARRHGRARRQPRQPRHARRRRRAVDDRRQRHPPPGDAARAIRTGRMHGFQLWANLPSSLKMTAPRYQDVAGERHSRGHRRRRHARARHLRRLLGQERARSRASPPTRAISTSRCRRASARRSPVETDATRVRLRVRGLRHVPRRVGSRTAC